MLKKLEATGRDVALATFASFIGALAVSTQTGHGSIGLDVVVAAGWGAVRFAVGYAAVAIQSWKSE